MTRFFAKPDRRMRLLPLLVGTGLVASSLSSVGWGARGELELSVVDSQTREPIAVQFQLVNDKQRPIKLPGSVRDGDWTVFDGKTVLKLPPGTYSFRLRRGLEYRERTGHFVIESAATDHHQVELPRFVDMAAEGWISGDLQVQPLSLAGLPTRILASDLHVIPVTTRDNSASLPVTLREAEDVAAGIGRQRHISFSTAADRRQGTLARLTATPLPAPPSTSQSLPTPFDFARSLRDQDPQSHVHLARATCWDMPVWAALGLVDSIGLFHDGITRHSTPQNAEDRPRDPLLFPDPEGMGRWSQQSYFRLLESGLKVPPGAGSGADHSGNPLGAARVYVHCGDDVSPASWWEGLRAGRVVVTNGPLLRPRVNGELPGHVFRGRTGETLQLEVELKLSTQQKIRYLEILQNGRPVQQVRLEDWAAGGGRLPAVEFHESGWLLVRAVAEDPDTFRAAVSGPFYVEFDGRPRVSRQAAEYLLEWVYQDARQLRAADPSVGPTVLLPHRAARDFWQTRVEQATTE